MGVKAMTGEFLFTLSLTTLVLGGLGCILLDWLWRPAAAPLAWFSSLLALGTGGLVLVCLPAGPLDFQGLLPGLAGGVAVRVTGFSGPLHVLVLLLCFLALTYCLGYFSPVGAPLRGPGGRKPPRWFAGLALWATAATSASFVTDSAAVLCVAWEVPTAALCLMLWLRGPARHRAEGGGLFGAARKLGPLWLGDGLFLAGVLLLVAGRRGDWALPLLLAGALAKGGAFPFHRWASAVARAAPPPAAALLTVGLCRLLGIVLLTRMTLLSPLVREPLRGVVLLLGAGALLVPTAEALWQGRLNKVLALQGSGQLGYVLLGIGSGTAVGLVGALLHLIYSTVHDVLLALTAGAVQEQTDTLRIAQLGGMARPMPLTFASFSVGAAAASALPPFGGFVSRLLVVRGLIEGTGPWRLLGLAAAVAGGALLTALLVHGVRRTFLGTRPPGILPRPARLQETPMAMLFPMGLLVGPCVLLGPGAGLVMRSVLAPGVLAQTGLWPAGLDAARAGALRFPWLDGSGLWAGMLVAGSAVMGVALYLVFVRRRRLAQQGPRAHPSTA